MAAIRVSTPFIGLSPNLLDVALDKVALFSFATKFNTKLTTKMLANAWIRSSNESVEMH